MSILIRDAAVAKHPVIGIASLASSVVPQSTRDKWIGWDGDIVVERFRDAQEPKMRIVKAERVGIADDGYLDLRRYCPVQQFARQTGGNAAMQS